MAFELPTLPFAYDALRPHMSEHTLRHHYGKHHKTYVEKLNIEIEGTPYAEMKLKEIIQKAVGEPNDKEIFNNAAQHWNHAFFWNCMTPGGGGQPEGAVARQIDADFGSFGKFAGDFVAAATGQFGSGWAWLILANGRLTIAATPNAETPMIHGHRALLTCDVWEHAYYLDYKNQRDEFVTTFLRHLVNWDFVAEQFALQGEGSSVAARSYRDAQHDFARSGKVAEKARAARNALEGSEAAELEQARKAAARGAKAQR